MKKIFFLMLLLANVFANAMQLNALRVIANECPYVYGPAVYQSRAILSAYDSVPTDYTNACEIIPHNTHLSELKNNTTTVPTQFKLYPNPNNGNMIFEYNLTQGNIGEFMIYNTLGQIIHIYNLQAGTDNKLQISESALKNGVYFYRLEVNGIAVKADKLVIIK